MKEKLTEELVAMRAAKELSPGDYCNLGIGIPLNCAAYAPEGVMLQSENGVLGYGPTFDRESMDENREKVDWDVADAGMRIDAKNHNGFPPMAAISLALMFTV